MAHVVSGMFDLIDQLVAQTKAPLAALTVPARVSDGLDVSEEYNDVLMVGIDDADLLGAANSASSVHTMTTASTQHNRDENGSVTLLALAYDGGGSAKSARDQVKAMSATVAALLRTDPSLGMGPNGTTGLGLTYPQFFCSFGQSYQLKQNQIEDVGAEAALVFTVQFFTTLRPF